MILRVVLAVVIGLGVGFGFMAYDKQRGAEWEVSPQQIDAAKAAGKIGYEARPGSVTVLPIRKETADALPVKWGMAGLVAAILVFTATRRPNRKA